MSFDTFSSPFPRRNSLAIHLWSASRIRTVRKIACGQMVVGRFLPGYTVIRGQWHEQSFKPFKAISLGERRVPHREFDDGH
jgi:hypothetical protein